MKSENTPVEPKRGYVMIKVVLKSGYVLSTYSYDDGYEFRFSEHTGECEYWCLEVPEGQPSINMACKEIAAVVITNFWMASIGKNFSDGSQGMFAGGYASLSEILKG